MIDRRIRVGFILVLVFVLLNMIFGFPAVAAAETDRPKIGLALGGGSAKGFEHIGVLLWLEENRIPVDYVAGTSMGGLMGGCYAMGMTPAEIRAFVANIDWDHLFDETPFTVLDYRRKEDWVDYPVDLEVGFRNKSFRYPSGLPVHRVGLLLSRLTLPYSTISNFDQLPIPFRCVATDLQEQKAVVLQEGSLAGALRATMAIPGVFTPVERDGHWLVDGGVLNNVPADVARSMGADIVIAVNVSGDIKDRNIRGIDNVVMQSVGTVIADNSRRSQEQADIVIKPDLGGLKSTDWKQVEKFIQLGYQAAARQGESLKKWALAPEQWRVYLAKRYEHRKTAVPIPAKIEVTGTSPANQELITERLRKYQGQPLDTEALEEELTDLTGTGLYESLRYESVIENGLPVLRIIVIEKSYGPPFVDFAFVLGVDSIRADHLDLDAQTRITWVNLAGPGSELRTDLGFGTDLNWQLELYEPLHRGPFFIAPAVFLEQDLNSLFLNGSRFSEYKTTDTGYRLDLGYTIDKFTEVRLGYSAAYQETATQVGDPSAVDGLDGVIQSFRIKVKYYNANRAQIPREGGNWDLESRWYPAAPGTDTDFGIVAGKLLWNFPVGNEDIIFTKVEGGGAINGPLPFLQQFKLGGPFRLGTYYYGQLQGSNYFLASLGYLKKLEKVPLLEKVYGGVWLESGAAFEEWSGMSLETNISVGLMRPTVFGPVYIGTSYGKGPNPLFYIGIGKIF